jgi:hypothetical protein
VEHIIVAVAQGLTEIVKLIFFAIEAKGEGLDDATIKAEVARIRQRELDDNASEWRIVRGDNP